MRSLVFITILTAPLAAWAGGFELVEQSPQGVATVGAQTAVADDAAAVFYNPAGMAFQAGFGALAGGNLGYVTSDVSSGSQTVSPNHTAFAPTLFAVQRLGHHFAVGVGSFSNFAEHFKYPGDWNGRFLGTFVDVTTATINFAVAWRPLNWLALGGGFDVVPASIDIYQGINFGGGEGQAHAGLTGVGVGGNAGLLANVYHEYLRFGFSYRSRVDVNFNGQSAINAPPEVQSQVAGLFNATTTLPLPHNFTFALSSTPIPQLVLSTDVHYTLWQDLTTLTLAQNNPSSGMTADNMVVLNLKNSWGVRFGGEGRVLDRRLRVRLGIGFDQTPVPRNTLGPLIPDTDRVVMGAGLGWHTKYWSLDASYLAAVLLHSTSENPDLIATYSTVGHVVSAGFTLRFAAFGGKLAANEVAWSNDSTKGDNQRLVKR